MDGQLPPVGIVTVLGGVIVTFAGIIGWVLKSALPAILDRMDKERDKKDAMLERIATTHAAEMKEKRGEFLDALEKVERQFADALDKQAQMMAELGRVVKQLADEVRDLRDVVLLPHGRRVEA